MYQNNSQLIPKLCEEFLLYLLQFSHPTDQIFIEIVCQLSSNFWVKMTLKSYFEGNILLFDFYFKGFDKIKALPKWMRNPDVLIQVHYGISGCGVFKTGIQNQKGFWLKTNCIQMKLPNFENWSNGELSKIGHHFSNKRL